MPLVHITEERLKTVLHIQETTSFDQNGAGISGIIQSICNSVARDVNASGRNDYLKPDTCQVPDGLEFETLVLIRHGILANFPSMESLLGEIRADEYRNAMNVLSDVRRGIIKLEPFDSESEPSILAASEPKQNWLIL